MWGGEGCCGVKKQDRSIPWPDDIKRGVLRSACTVLCFVVRAIVFCPYIVPSVLFLFMFLSKAVRISKKCKRVSVNRSPARLPAREVQHEGPS